MHNCLKGIPKCQPIMSLINICATITFTILPTCLLKLSTQQCRENFCESKMPYSANAEVACKHLTKFKFYYGKLYLHFRQSQKICQRVLHDSKQFSKASW